MNFKNSFRNNKNVLYLQQQTSIEVGERKLDSEVNLTPTMFRKDIQTGQVTVDRRSEVYWHVM